MKIEVGSSVWLFDINRRVYVDDAGNKTSSPVWRHHWRECLIVGETSRSWILDYFETKIPKKGFDERKVCFSMKDVLDQVWVHDNRYKIELAIRDLSLKKLRKVATVIGYKGS